MITIFKRLIFIVILFLSTNVLADYPNIPKDLDKNFCDKKGGKFGHVITIIDITSDLDDAQVEFIKDQVFSEEFFMDPYPFTKFSYFLINNKKPQEQEFLFSKCRPKTGNKRFRKNEKATWKENVKVLEKYSSKFFSDAKTLSNEIFKEKTMGRKSYRLLRKKIT